MRRSLLTLSSILSVYFLAPANGMAQAVASLFERDDARELASTVTALEKSRDALLQAREAVDTALLEVDHALGVLRSAVIARHTEGTRPANLWSEPAPSAPGEGRAWIETVSGALEAVRTALNERFAAWLPAVEEVRWAACVAHAASGESEKDAGRAPADDGSPGPGAPSAPLPAILREEDLKPRYAERLAQNERFGASEGLRDSSVPGLPVEEPSQSTAEAVGERAQEAIEAAPAIPALPTLAGASEPDLPTIGASEDRSGE